VQTRRLAQKGLVGGRWGRGELVAQGVDDWRGEIPTGREKGET